MQSDNKLDLSDFKPVSELKVKENKVTYPKYPVIDIHSHFGKLLLGDDYDKVYDMSEAIASMKHFGIRNTINLDGFNNDDLDKMLKKTHPFESFMLTFGNVDVTKLDDADFEVYVKKTLHESKAKGIKGLKFWKVIGLDIKDKSGKYITPDDKRLKVIWETAAELDLPVLFHIADPIAFFKPIDGFNERYEELQANPDWSFCAPELYSFEELMKMQENLLRDNPNTTFIIAHGGSCSENLSYVSSCLDRFPNMNIDIAARISEFGRQPYTSRKFFEKYQDRILFGTDASPMWDEYPCYYRFLETWDEYFDYSNAEVPGQGRWKIYGIGLEDEILKKVYYKNAERILKL